VESCGNFLSENIFKLKKNNMEKELKLKFFKVFSSKAELFTETAWFEFLEHIFKKWALLKSLCRPSVCPSVRLSVCPSVRLSVCPSVTYFSAGIAPRELKFST
jgi:hypothetical protein